MMIIYIIINIFIVVLIIKQINKIKLNIMIILINYIVVINVNKLMTKYNYKIYN